MTTLHYGSTTVTLDVDVPSAVLDEEGARLFAAFDDLGAQVRAKQDEAQDARDAVADESRAIAVAAQSGKPTPKAQGADYWRARADVLDREAALMARRQKVAGDEFEAHVLGSSAIRERLAAMLAETHADGVDLVSRAQAASAQERSLAALVRSLCREAARRTATTPNAAHANVQAVDDYFATAHRQDAGHVNPGALSAAWATVASGVVDLPVSAYADVNPAALIAGGHEAQRQATFAAPGVETDAQRIARLLAQAGAPASAARPAVKSIGQVSPEDAQATADARRAEVRAASF